MSFLNGGMRFCGMAWQVIIALSCAGIAYAAESNLDQQPFHQQFHIQAHRGAGIAVPENTLEAFEASWELGVVPEADLRTSKDGVIVCFHDADFRRVVGNIDDSGRKESVEQLDWPKIAKLEVGSFRGDRFAGQYVPSLTDVFAAMRGRPDRLLYLDIKTVNLDQLASLIREFGVERQVIFTSEKYPLIRQWKEKVPESMTLIWNRGDEDKLNAKLQTLRDSDFEGITYLQIHVFVDDPAGEEPFKPSSAYLQRVGKELAGRGIVFQVLPWECSDPRAYARLLELGVASFATDYPELTVQAVRDFLQSKN